MPVQTSYPGVYIQELPSDTRTITGVSTSVPGILGTFAKGPVNEAVEIFSFADFEREFGGISRDHEASYAVSSFYQTVGSGRAFIVRVAEDAETSLLDVQDTTPTTLFQLRAGRRVRNDSADSPGEAGDNLRVEFDLNTLDPTTRFNLTVTEVAVQNDRTEEIAREEFRNLTFNQADSRFVLDFVNARSRLVQVNFPGAVPAIGTQPAVVGVRSSALAAPPGAVADYQNLEISLVVDDGVAPITIGPFALPDFGATIPTTMPELAGVLQAAIRSLASDTAPELDPNWDPTFRPYLAGARVEVVDGASGDRHLRVYAGRGARPFLPMSRFEFSEAVGGPLTAFGLDTSAGAQFGPQQFPLTGGTQGTLWDGGVLNTQITMNQNSFIGSPANSTGIHAFNDVNDYIGFFLLPEAAWLADGSMRAVYSALIAYASERRAMAIIDVPNATNSLETMQTWLDENALFRDPNAVVYFPRPYIPDSKANGALRDIGASGCVSGLWAANDTARGPWITPAGITMRLSGVPALSYNLTDLQHGVLNQLGVDCLRSFPVYGNIVWGGRTLEGADALASEWKYLPVRRMMLFLQESLFRGTQWAVFEPNDETLWGQMRMAITAFLTGIYRQGGLQGSSRREAFFVQCDAETTSATDRANGIVRAIIGVALLRPAEFVILEFKQQAGGATA